MIFGGSGFYTCRQLLIGELVFPLCTQTDCQHWPDAVHLWMSFQHALHYSGSGVDLASIVQDSRLKGLNHRVLRFNLGALVQFFQCLLVPPLIHENSGSVITGYYFLAGIEPDHSVETT